MQSTGFGLGWLLFPYNIDEFKEAYWRAKPRHIARKAPSYYSLLMTAEEVDSMITSACKLDLTSVKALSYDAQPEECLRSRRNSISVQPGQDDTSYCSTSIFRTPNHVLPVGRNGTGNYGQCKSVFRARARSGFAETLRLPRCFRGPAGRSKEVAVVRSASCTAR